MLLENSTWAEVAEYLTEKQTVIFPVGSIEQQGPHLCTGFESSLAESVAEELGKKTNTMVMPVFPFNYAEQMSDFPGTISISRNVLTEVLYDMAYSIVSHGARKIMFVNVHLGSMPSIESVARKLKKEFNVRSATCDIYSLLKQLSGDILDPSDEPFGHASVVQTSLAMYLFPHLVRENKKTADRLKPLGESISLKGSNTALFKGVNVFLYSNTKEGTDTGCGGNALNGDPKSGEELFNRLISFCADFMQALNAL